jgi:hypothetical protein
MARYVNERRGEGEVRGERGGGKEERRGEGRKREGESGKERTFMAKRWSTMVLI